MLFYIYELSSLLLISVLLLLIVFGFAVVVRFTAFAYVHMLLLHVCLLYCIGPGILTPISRRRLVSAVYVDLLPPAIALLVAVYYFCKSLSSLLLYVCLALFMLYTYLMWSYVCVYSFAVAYLFGFCMHICCCVSVCCYRCCMLVLLLYVCVLLLLYIMVFAVCLCTIV